MPHPAAIRLPHAIKRYSSQEVSEICARVAAGDRSSEPLLLSCMTRRLVHMVGQIITRQPHLEEHRDDLLEEAALSVIRYGRKYRYTPDGAPADKYLDRCARLDIRAGARDFMSPIAAKPLDTSQNDFTDPCFQGYAPLGLPEASKESIDSIIVGAPDTREVERIRNRFNVRNMLQKRLSPRENRVICKLYGIAECQASKDRWCNVAARSARRYAPHEVAFVFGLTTNQVRQIRDRALAKLSRIQPDEPATPGFTIN